MSKDLGVDTATDKSPCMDTVTARCAYSDASFLLLPILHQKVRNVENLRGKICAFVLVTLEEGSLKHDETSETNVTTRIQA